MVLRPALPRAHGGADRRARGRWRARRLSPPSQEAPVEEAPIRKAPAGDGLAIVIVGHDDREDLRRCLESLLRTPPTGLLQIVVVDNASTDGTGELLAERWPQILRIENRTNVGFARAVNQGIRATSSELVLLLNPDTLPSGPAIDALRSGLEADAGAVAAGPRIVDGEGRPEISWWSHLDPFAEWRLRRLRLAYDRGDPAAARRVEQLTSSRREVDWLTGACLLLRRRAAAAAGLMDESYFLYFDDVDLCATLRGAGGRILFLPDAEIVHLRGRTVARRPAATARRYRTSQLHFYRKHHPYWYPLLRLMLRLRGELPSPEAPAEPGAGS